MSRTLRPLAGGRCLTAGGRGSETATICRSSFGRSSRLRLEEDNASAGRGVQSARDRQGCARLVRSRRLSPRSSVLFAGVRPRRGDHAAVVGSRPRPHDGAGRRLERVGVQPHCAARRRFCRNRRSGGGGTARGRARAGHVRRLSARVRGRSLVSVARSGGVARSARRGDAGAGGRGPGSDGGRHRNLDRGHRLHLGRWVARSLARNDSWSSSRARGGSWPSRRCSQSGVGSLVTSTTSSVTAWPP